MLDDAYLTIYESSYYKYMNCFGVVEKMELCEDDGEDRAIVSQVKRNLINEAQSTFDMINRYNRAK